MLAALDLGILNFSFLMSELAAGNSLHTNMGSSYFSISPELALFGCYSLAIIVIFQHENLYKINVFLSGADQIVKVATALFYSVLGLAFNRSIDFHFAPELSKPFQSVHHNCLRFAKPW